MTEKEGPGCPSDLDTIAKAHWRRIKGHLERRGDWTAPCGYLLELLCRAEQRARDARKAMVDEDGKQSLTAAGYKGQAVQHPNLKTARDAELDVLKYLTALRLTPQELARGGGEAPKPTKGGKFDGAFE